MVNQEHLDIIKKGVDAWNNWRKEHPKIRPDLVDAKLSYHDLQGVNFFGADLFKAKFVRATLSNSNLSKAILSHADLYTANLRGANLEGADLIKTNFTKTILNNANLSYTTLIEANLDGADLREANLSSSRIGWTFFGDVDLHLVKGLELVHHQGPSSIGIDTIYNSKGNIPETFLRGAGIDDTFIEYIRSLVGKPIQYYTCFISYCSEDQTFVNRLYADLQNNNVRCWYALEDLKIGDKFRHRIDESIRIYDKLLLVLSEASLASSWVSYEVEKALDKEPEGKPNVLFPIRLDKAILTSETDWAKDIRKSRHIGDFEHWKEHDAYQIALKRLLRDLKAQS